MRLKQCFFALVAMLLCAFSATAQVTTEAELKEALTAGGEVTLGADITTTAAITTSGVTSVIDLNGKTLTIGAGDNKFYDASNITIKNGTISITGVTVNGNAIFCLDEYEETLVTTLTLDNVNLVGEGYSSAYCIFYIGDSSVLNVKGGVWNLKNDASTAGGVFKGEASAATLNIDGLQLTAHNVRRVVTYAATTIANSTLAISGDADGVDAEMEHGFNRSPLAISNSTITMTDMVGRGITAENGAVTISGNSTVTMTNCQEATIDVRNGQTVTIDNTSTVAVDKEPTISSGTISGTVKLPVVAKISDVEYSDFAAALTAASKMSGDVTVEVYDKVTLNTAFSGSYSSINFVGKDTDAEIYLDVQGYITATGKKVSFTDLTLSKSEGDYLTNAGFMNVAFGIYDVVEVTYTNCVFANGAYASSGNVTFTGCTFKKSWEKYGLWAYGNVNVAVEGCKFDNDRGIKMYAEDKAKTTDLTVKSCDFSALTGKPAIVLTYGESVVLEGNTYSSTGTFELDKDGDPNGTAVTSDVAPTCMNDDYPACGVLVDGKIYTTVAQAAEVAAKGSNVTLLYSTTDAVEFAEGVNLTLADGVTADNVTVATSAVAKIGETSYATLAEAVAAVGAGDVVIELLDDVTLDYGAREAYGTAETTSVTINGNGKTLTLNQTNSDWSSFGLAAGKVAFNNVTIEKTGYGDTSGAWNTHAIIFSSPVEMTNVTVNNSMAVQAGATLNNVTINEANGYYGLWVNGNGQTVTMNGGAINATNGGRGIKVADQYIDAPAQVTLNVTGTAFNTAKKAAVLVSSTAGAKIAASNVDITEVAADNQNMVWVDEDRAANYGAVEVTGATVAQEAVESFPIVVKNGENVVSYFKTLQEALDAAAAGTGNVTVTILEDVDLTDVDWNPVTVSAPGYPVVTVEGNNKTITGLNDMLFAGTWAGGSGLIIKDLTIANSAIVNDKDDAKGTIGVGAFIGYPQASATITLENCHLKNSSVEGGHWTGGLIGMAGGYNGNDGPVFMNLTIKGCSVTGSTITGKGSVGGVIGHGSCAAWTNVVIEETTVSGNTITSTGSSNVKAGAVMGTIGAAGQPTTANGETKTGGASVSATVAGNTVTSNGTAITTIYGRQGTATGQLYVAGGSYDNYPIEQGVAYAAPVEGYVIVENADGTYGLDEKVELPEVVITDIKESLKDSDPDLTFALNFTIKDLENLDEEYLNKVMEQYGSWYTDYVLTISGLTEENVTFNANGNGDGYLAGQYDAWSENWVSVPFEDVTLADGESIYIMEYAAKLMGQSGLRYTLAEIATIVQNFDCGVYFSPEFLTANPGLQVDLHLKVFTEDAEGNKVNDINVATNEFDVEDYVAIVHASGKQTTYCTTLADAVAAAEADETITLIADVELTETLNIPAGKEVVLDLNGKTISQTKEQTAGYQMILNDGKLTINDSSEAKTGKISYTDSGNGGEYISDVIYNRSVLVINGGTIENLSSATVASNGYPHAVDTYSGIRDTYVEINGGTIYCAEYSAIRMFCVSATNKADLVINGGTIKGAIDMQNGTKNLALGTLTINDGTFETTKNANNIRFANWNGGATEYGISAAIKGGSFNGGITTTYVPAAANWDKGVITGGTFAKDMTEYCAEGFVCEANSDGTYGVVANPSYIAELTIDDANPVDYTSDFEGKTVGKLTYKRSLIGGIWNPFFVPFEIDIERLVNEFGLEVAYYNQMISTENADGGFDYKMEVKHLTSGVISHYPLFVKVATDTEIEYVAEDVVLGSADEFVITTSSVTNTFKLYGTHQAKSVSDLEGKYAINALNGQWTPSTSGIKPHRLYLEIQENNNNPFSSSPAKSIGIVVRGEDGFTGIEEVTGDANENVIFDLQGRRILEPQKGELYIINGKKVIY